MRDIAKLAGVSHVTVSMALRDSPRISLEVREKIRKVAEAEGYRPDPMLTALSAYRRSKSDSKPIDAAIAWLNAWPQPEKLRGYKEFDLYWRGASKAAEKYGYRLEEFNLNEQYTAKRLHQVFQTRNIRGILLPPHGGLSPAWQDFPWKEYSIVRFGRSLENPLTHLVTADQFTNSMVAFQALQDRGYSRIGFIALEVDLQPRGHHFAGGYLAIQEGLGMKNRIPVFTIGDHPREKLILAFQRWMKKYNPDALLSSICNISSIISEAGYRVPQDVALAATSVLDGGVDSGIDQHPEEIGRVGFLMLNSLINDGSRGIPKIFRQNLVEGSWVDGASLPDRRKRAREITERTR